MTKPLAVDTLHETILDLVKRVEKLLTSQASNPRQRILVALAGVPGSGKSTISNALIAELALRGIQDVSIVPMVSYIRTPLYHTCSFHVQDGFHYSQAALSTFDDAETAFRRRGAPFTFDAEAFVRLVTKLKAMPVTTPTETELIVSAPNFDHATKDPSPNAIAISSQNRVIIVEGNYTLLNLSPWNEIAKSCAEKYAHESCAKLHRLIHPRWFVDAPIDTVRDRLAERHLAAGIEDSMQAAVQRANENDIPNGAMIRSMLIKPDVVIEN
jgi:pantothenate kinase